MRDVRERVLVLLLRLGGVVTATAFLTILMPPDLQATVHEKLGMGEMPRSAVYDSLTRTIAGLYGFLGVLLLLVSTNVRRFRPIVVFVATMNIVFGALVIAIDAYAGMPLYWTLGEGPPVIAFGVAILYLLRSVPEPEPVSPMQ